MEMFNKEYRTEIINFCFKLMKDDFNIIDIKQSISLMDWMVKDMLPELKKDVYISTVLNLVVTEVEDSEDLSQQEKDNIIWKYVESSNLELQELAPRLIKQININYQEFAAYAKQHGYCPELFKDDSTQKDLRKKK